MPPPSPPKTEDSAQTTSLPWTFHPPCQNRKPVSALRQASNRPACSVALRASMPSNPREAPLPLLTAHRSRGTSLTRHVSLFLQLSNLESPISLLPLFTQIFQSQISNVPYRSHCPPAALPLLTAHGSRLTAHGSRLTAHGSRLTAHGSRLTAHNMTLWMLKCET
jgi:hypothetical protein